MNKKKILADVLSATGVLSGCRHLLTPHNAILPILAYHRIKPVDTDYPFDSELISATPEEFLWQMQHIKHYYNPIRLSELGNYFSGQTPWPARPVVITFDDGFDDNYHYAFPVLQQEDIPATIFVTTDYIDSSTSYWFDFAVFLLKKLTIKTELKTADNQFAILLDPGLSIKTLQRELFIFLKRIPDVARQEILQKLSQAVDVYSNPNPLSLLHSKAMTWDNIREMSNSGVVDIGSHTLSHPILNQISREQLVEELQQSKQLIENKTGKPCYIMAYPFGGDDITSPQVIQEVANAGYQLACMYQKAYTSRMPDNLLKLERIHIETDITRSLFAAMLALPGLFA